MGRSAKRHRLPLFLALSQVDREGPEIPTHQKGHARSRFWLCHESTSRAPAARPLRLGNRHPAKHVATHEPVSQKPTASVHNVEREVSSFKLNRDVFVAGEQHDARGDDFSGLGGFHAVGSTYDAWWLRLSSWLAWRPGLASRRVGCPSPNFALVTVEQLGDVHFLATFGEGSTFDGPSPLLSSVSNRKDLSPQRVKLHSTLAGNPSTVAA